MSGQQVIFFAKFDPVTGDSEMRAGFIAAVSRRELLRPVQAVAGGATHRLKTF
jgi:hypothetical protein